MIRAIFNELAYVLNLYNTSVVVIYNSHKKDYSERVARLIKLYMENLEDGKEISSSNVRKDGRVIHNPFQITVKYVDDIVLANEVEEVKSHRTNGTPRALHIIALNKNELPKSDNERTRDRIYCINIKGLSSYRI